MKESIDDSPSFPAAIGRQYLELNSIIRNQATCMNPCEVWTHGRSAPQAVIPHFLALPVSWVLMYTTLAASVGKVWGWRLIMS